MPTHDYWFYYYYYYYYEVQGWRSKVRGHESKL
jgi:hypothetical protein